MARDPLYDKQRRNTKRRLKGKIFAGKIVTEVGDPSDARYNAPTLVPVRFADGTYGIIWDEKSGELLASNNPKVNRAIKFSRKMPVARPGIGSGVIWVNAYPKKDAVKFAGIKVFYNDKADRRDLYGEISWTQAAARRIADREARGAEEAQGAAA